MLLDDAPDAHLRHIKVTPTVEEEVDRCVECGYCEPVCPSRDLTLTPRQRIVLRRAMATAESVGDHQLADELAQSYEYPGVQTCAVDGMCGTACPVQINTGDLVRRLRRENQNRLAERGWALAARHWGTTSRAASAALTAAAAVPAVLPATASRAGRAVAGADTVPLWSADLPRGGRPRRRPHRSANRTRCTCRRVSTRCSARPATAPVCRTVSKSCARWPESALLIPSDVDALCCGTPWSSKGMETGYRTMRDRTATAVVAATRGGELPLVCDASSCTEGLVKMLRESAPQVRVIDAVTLIAERVLPGLADHPRLDSLTVHPNLLVDTARCERRATGHRPRDRPRRRRAAGLGLLRIRGRPGHAAPGAHRVGHR